MSARTGAINLQIGKSASSYQDVILPLLGRLKNKYAAALFDFTISRIPDRPLTCATQRNPENLCSWPGIRCARSGQANPFHRHCEKRSDEAIRIALRGAMDCFAALAMTGKQDNARAPSAAVPPPMQNAAPRAPRFVIEPVFYRSVQLAAAAGMSRWRFMTILLSAPR
jgi:hypothetical protein